MNKTIPLIAAISLTLGACAPMNDPYGGSYGTPYGGGGSMLAPAAGALGGGAVSGLACSALGRGNGKTAIVGACSMLGGIAGLLAGMQYSQNSQAQAYQPQRQPLIAPRIQYPYQQQQPYEEEGVLRMGRQFSNPSTGEQCREFQHTARVGGKAQQVYGTACQQRDGTWKIVG